ncbi:MAG: sigma-70 family RNA polymerase sigma factor [Oscillospiraceae bacterium]|jgi:RNA polymerase sigma-70 factor (ECF subfamily)|nr:sigma-70 family RNA polymerase sigma factor [Oscillospiraceae bacterium]
MSNPNIASRFDEIYDSTNKYVLAYITAKCRSTADIGDVFQDAYLELYQVLCKRGADYITNEKAFVLKIAKRKLARYYSLLERLKIFVFMNAVNGDGETADLTEFEADSFLTEEFVVNKDLVEKAKQLINAKSEDIQKVFYLFYDVDLTIPEISKAMSISEQNVKNKLYRTLKELREILK